MATPLQLYICIPCGHIHDPTARDPDSDVAHGTPFEAIPDDWVCPSCFAGKADFEPWLPSA